jgi:Transposase DDE domain
MDAFKAELMWRSPLAACVLEACDFVFDDQLLDSIWEQHRGRCYQDVLRFGDLLRMMRDALIRHQGSAHRMYLGLEKRDAQVVDESNFYRKLARMPVEISRALLSGCTQRLRELTPGEGVELPHCFDGFEVIAADGKKIKNATKRLKPTRNYSGKLLGAKALVALDIRSGLAIAMSDSLDGMTNDVPLVPLLMPQLYEAIPARAILSVWDRQFDDPRTLRRLSARPGDAFVVRMKQMQMPFEVQETVETRDAAGRRVVDEIGVLSRGKRAMRIRRITLFRDQAQGEEDVVLLTNLLDRRQYSAQDLLELYRFRWDIEEVFQQVTQTFSLEHLIGCSPKAILLQFSFCLLLYNLMQVIKAYVAEDGAVLASVISMFYLFDDVRTELMAWAYHTDGSWPRVRRDASEMRQRLRALLKGSWNPITYRKASDKKPRGRPKPKLRLHGGHSSVLRAMEGRAKVVTT